MRNVESAQNYLKKIAQDKKVKNEGVASYGGKLKRLKKKQKTS